MNDVATIGVVGTKGRGAEWIARYLARGFKVVAWDIEDSAEASLREMLQRVWPSLIKIGLFPGASQDNLTFASDLRILVEGVDFVHECSGDRRRVAQLADKVKEGRLIVSSPDGGHDALAEECGVVIARPESPAYLLPMVELSAGGVVPDETIDDVSAFFTSVGMRPIRTEGGLSAEIEQSLSALIDNCRHAGISLEMLDEAFLHGRGLLTAVLGPVQSAGPLAAEQEHLRDECLIAVMQALRTYQQGAGRLLQEDESRRITTGQEFSRWQHGDVVAAPLELYQSTVLPEWVDYNGHMTEAAYLTAFGWASDALFRYIGDDEAYRDAGLSFYTVETHINYFQECSTGEPLRFTTQLLGVDEKRMHLFHSMYHSQTGALLATTEQMLLHVDMKAARACPIRDDVYAALCAIMNAHRNMDLPKQVGRQMAIKKR